MIEMASTGIQGFLATISSPSPALASKVFGWANLGLLASLVVGAVSTGLIVWMGGIKEDALRADIANADLKTEQLRKENLQLETKLLELKKDVHGRTITDAQHDQIIAAVKGRKVPELVTYMARDPEARFFGFSIVSLFQKLGMKGQVVMMEDAPPMQTGVMYCGTDTEDDRWFVKILMDAGIVGVGSPGSRFGRDKFGNEIVLPYCPPGSLFVGIKNPLSEIRTFSPPHPPKGK
jgi:hypothetical protein